MNSDYWKSFLNEKPTKQAKSYEIDLGQTVSKIIIISCISFSFQEWAL